MEETEDLVRLFQCSTDQGERNRTFGLLYNRYKELVEVAAGRYRTLRNEARIEDVVQNTFIFVAQHLDGFLWATEHKFRSWLINTAVFKAKEEMRKRSKAYSIDTVIDEVSEVPDSSPDSSVEAATYEDSALTKLFEVWQKFDPEGYKANCLFHIYGKTNKDIANILGLSSAEAARKRRTRALKLFRDYLLETYGTDSLDEWIEGFFHLSIEERPG